MNYTEVPILVLSWYFLPIPSLKIQFRSVIIISPQKGWRWSSKYRVKALSTMGLFETFSQWETSIMSADHQDLSKHVELMSHWFFHMRLILKDQQGSWKKPPTDGISQMSTYCRSASLNTNLVQIDITGNKCECLTSAVFDISFSNTLCCRSYANTRSLRLANIQLCFFLA